MMFEHFPLEKNWPNLETAMTVFRYAIIRELCRGKKVLEIGAASGEGTALFADVAKEVVALDHQNIWDGSPTAEMSNVRFVCQDALSMPVEWAGYFDVVLAMELIEHLEDPNSFQNSVFDILSKEGILVLSTPNFDIYSDKGDSSRKPLYVHHHHEYCAEELRSFFSNAWKGKKIMGLSQLSFPKMISEDGGSEVLLYFEKGLYQLRLGVNYPQYELFKGESLPYSLPLEFCQSFIALLCKRAYPTRQLILSKVKKSKTSHVSVGEIAFHSCRVILQRRNEQCASMEKHVENLENIVKDREGQIEQSKQVIGDLEKNLLEAKKATEGQIERTERIIGELNSQVTQLRRRLPFRLAEKIAGKKLIAIPELDKAP
jgi:2-polyprenyl-3-methyl-5-hydroxy-6-metoxy-1,4-benzoquinol methylase